MPEEVVKTEKDKDKPPKVPKKSKTQQVLNKVIIRRLPPNFTSEEFISGISPLPEFNDFYFVNADLSLGADSTSRAYIEFKNQDDIFLFKDKFDGYVFLDSLKGTEYPAIVEYAPFQGLPKSRARKDKHVNTIDSEQHFQNFLENLKKAEESENQKGEGKLEFSFQLKDDKKITSTPLLEFLAAAKEEKREAKRKKIEEKKKSREEEKIKKKKEVAKSIPEPIKESKEEIVYDDGVIVRTVPSRLSRNDKNARKESKLDATSDTKTGESSKPDREAIERERKEKKRIQREKDEKRKMEREQQKLKDKEAKLAREKTKADASPKEETSSKSQPAKREVKRYSELRKARQEKPTDGDGADNKEEVQTSVNSEEPLPESAPTEEDARWKKIQEAREKRAMQKDKKDKKSSDDASKKAGETSEKSKEDQNDAKFKRIQEMREKRAREKESRAQKERDERPARQIRNKDRPTMQIYRPKRVNEEGSNDKSSDEKSESARERLDSIKSDKRSKDNKRKNSREERRRKGSRKGSSNEDEAIGIEKETQREDSPHDLKADTADTAEGSKVEDVTVKMEKLVIEKASDDDQHQAPPAEEKPSETETAENIED